MRSPTTLLFALLLAHAGLARSAHADGNVTASVDQAGDLWIVGDEESNSLRIRDASGNNGEFVLSDDSGTTSVNGAPSVTLHATGNRILVSMGGGDDQVTFGGGFYVCCDRQVLFQGGEGDDVFRLQDESSALDALDVDLGPGADRFEAGEGSVLGALDLRCGDGDDVVLMGPFVIVEGGLSLDLGSGANTVDLNGVRAHGSLTIVGGPEVDTIHLDALDVAGFVTVASGAGDDEIEIGTLHPLAPLPLVRSGPLIIDSDQGDDRILIRGACDFARGLIVRAGAGRDAVEFSGARVDGACTIELGGGDDQLHIDGSQLGLELVPALVSGAGHTCGPLLFDGGAGRDLYVQGAHVEFPHGAPTLRNFDAPRIGEPPALEVVTHFVGRIVQFHAPIANATVSIAELGLTTSADDSGAFRIDSANTPLRPLKLTAGATVGGRHLCGTLQVRAEAEAVVDVGELELRPDCSNALLFGDAEDASAALAEILLASGVESAEVQREHFLPEDLSTFAVAWFAPENAPLTQSEQQRLIAFVRAGGGLHLCGEGAAIQAANEALVNALVLGGGVTVGVPQGSLPWYPLLYAPDAVEGASVRPNRLRLVMDFITGGQALGGVAHPNVFIAGASGQVFGALWSGSALVGGEGRLSLGLSTLWFRSAGNAAAIENLYTFLARPPGMTRGR